jgi:hypothetical protein
MKIKKIKPIKMVLFFKNIEVSLKNTAKENTIKVPISKKCKLTLPLFNPI